jgi:hypothetical protein
LKSSYYRTSFHFGSGRASMCALWPRGKRSALLLLHAATDVERGRDDSSFRIGRRLGSGYSYFLSAAANDRRKERKREREREIVESDSSSSMSVPFSLSLSLSLRYSIWPYRMMVYLLSFSLRVRPPLLESRTSRPWS